MECPKCHYIWNSRKKEPKECPKCKQRINYSSTTYGEFSGTRVADGKSFDSSPSAYKDIELEEPEDL